MQTDDRNASAVEDVDVPSRAVCTDVTPLYVKNVDDYNALCERNASGGLHVVHVLVFGATACTRCPAASQALCDMASERNFSWNYIDAHDSNLTEYLGVHKLPALLVVRPRDAEVHMEQGASYDETCALIRRTCLPVLEFNDDF